MLRNVILGRGERDALCHRSISMTEKFVSPQLAQKCASAVTVLLDAPTVGRG
jgi:hypothetical protein